MIWKSQVVTSDFSLVVKLQPLEVFDRLVESQIEVRLDKGLVD